MAKLQLIIRLNLHQMGKKPRYLTIYDDTKAIQHQTAVGCFSANLLNL